MLVSKKSFFSDTMFSLALALGVVSMTHLPTLAESQPAVSGKVSLGLEEASLTFEPMIAKLPSPTSAVEAGGRIFEPPDEGSNPTTAGGGTRGGSCISRDKSIIPLMPTNNSILTVSEYPTFYAYVPESSAKTARFVLREQGQDDDAVYETTFNIPDTPGIVSVDLPETALPPLKIGKIYHWYLVLVCDPEDSSRNAIADGWIERIEPSASLARQLEKTSLRDRPRVYGKAGIWQDTLATLAQLHRSSPTDPTITADWEKLLSEAGLSEVAKHPLVNCCIAQN